ncbi:glycosyltransferase family 4 protein [Candidatus Roizmanbacteria bacterium]|nr:glycosyltransferase family 4 protein [Candidatus Roizmanbacteria bacterium]
MTRKKTVIAFLNAYTQGKSGGDVALIEIFRRLKGVDLTVVTSELGKKLCLEKKLKATYLLTTSEKEFSNIVVTYLIRIIIALFLIGKSQKSDIVYATSDALPDVLPALFLKLRYRNSVLWLQKIFHTIPADRFISHHAQKMSFFFIKHFVDKIVVSNTYTKSQLLQHGFPINKITINHLGIDYESIAKISASSKKFDAVFMGRLHSSKGIFDLPEIWQKVVNKIPNARLAIIGTGEASFIGNLQLLISKYNLKKNITMLGYLSNQEAFSLIKSGRLFLFPSYEEGFSLTVGEAMACGTPVMAYTQPAYDEIFKEAVIQIPAKNIELFSKKILDLLQDKYKRTILKKKGLELVKNFNWDMTVKKEKDLMNL